MVLKANDRSTSCPCHDEFREPRSDYVRQVASENHKNINDAHQLTDFTALTELLPAITEPSDVLHTHYACRTSTRHIYV
ncbi:hypothetical protein TNCV_105191 [Trichonephila clavipes]|nr:hypothetical protein TNCV_105191 [Trichonephila clavipes]